LLDAFPDTTVVVVGRADQRGPAERNLGIAERRTEATIDHLVIRGVDPAQLTAMAIGESQLTSDADAEVAYALNRRVEFVVYGLGG
jgi:outer membrane protein OmpA-like peptidoglycan-associated protein